MVHFIADVCGKLFYLMLLNFYWWRFTLLGGVVFSFIPATITVYECLRKRILDQNEQPLKELFKERYIKNKNYGLSCCIWMILLLFIFQHHVFMSVSEKHILLEFMIGIYFLLGLLLCIVFFPVQAYFSLDKYRLIVQPLIFIFICPIQTIVSGMALYGIYLLYLIFPVVAICFGIAPIAYMIGFLFFKKFEKMRGQYF